MEKLQKIYELFKSDAYKQKTENPYVEENREKIRSSFISSYDISKNGWRISELTPVSDLGNYRGEPVDYHEIIKNNDVNEDLLKMAITTAMSEIFNQDWIDDYNVPSDKEFSLVYLGKIGLEIGSKLYTPTFVYPGLKDISGDGLWMSTRSRENKDNEDIEQMAKTPSIFYSGLGDSELEKKSLDRINGSILADFHRYKEERAKMGKDITKLKPRTYTPIDFAKRFRVIRDVKDRKGEERKDFFIAYKDGLKTEDEVYNYVVYEVTGKAVSKAKVRSIIKPEQANPSGRKKAEGDEYFNLDPNDERLEGFYYYSQGSSNPMLKPDAYNFVKIVKNTVEKVDARNKPGERRLLVQALFAKEGVKPGTKFTLTLKRGDKLKVPYIKGRTPLEMEQEKSKDPKIKKPPIFKEAVVGLTNDIPLNKKRIRVNYVED